MLLKVFSFYRFCRHIYYYRVFIHAKNRQFSSSSSSISLYYAYNQTLKYLPREKYMACLFIFFHVLSYATSSSFSSDTLREGASLSVQKADDVLVSSNGVFSAGFHYVGQNGYCFAIWFNHPPYNYSYPNRTVVWMANRDKPVNNGKHSKLSLQKDGNLVLNDGRRLIVWATNTVSVSSTFLLLLDTGNLVLKDYSKVDVVLWQSFHSSTDTLLPLQPLTKSIKLISSRSQSNFSTGFYIFTFSDDNLLRLIFDKNEVSSVYWPPLWLSFWEVGRSTSNDSKIATLSSLGNFTSSDGFRFLSTDYGSDMIQRRLRMDDDGNVRLYSRKIDGTGWYVSWQAISDPCMINGICGVNGICTYDPSSGRSCSCFPGHKMKDPSDWTEGCVPKFNPSCKKNDSRFIKLAGVRLNGHDYGFFPNYTLSQCQDLCSSVCDCKGIIYAFSEDTGTYNCYPKTLLLNGYRTTRFYGDIYMRLPKSHYLPLPEDKTSTTEESVLQCFDEPELTIKEEEEENDLVKHLLWFAVGTGGFQIICFVSVWSLLFIRSKSRNSESDGARYLIGVTAGMYRKYSYDELKKATWGFKEEIGRGSGGIVYKGVLPNDRVAAVKLLINDEANNHDQGEAEFLAAISTLGRLNHMHLMKIWGYCAEGKHRLLVFEYLEHGSLKHNLSSNVLDWGMRFKISLGTAKGLAYLHEECLEWILHCDVKPDNILLDSDYSPKVADFGLCKLLKRGELNKSEFSRIRGTRGYLAPEWVSNQSITSKVDVYSYGLVVLEMLTGKSPTTDVQTVNGTGEIEDKRSLVSWVRENIKETSSDEIAVLLEKIVDPSLGEEYDLKEMEKLLEVAMKCVEVDRGARPTMRQVVEMLLD